MRILEQRGANPVSGRRSPPPDPLSSLTPTFPPPLHFVPLLLFFLLLARALPPPPPPPRQTSLGHAKSQPLQDNLRRRRPFPPKKGFSSPFSRRCPGWGYPQPSPSGSGQENAGARLARAGYAQLDIINNQNQREFGQAAGARPAPGGGPRCPLPFVRRGGRGAPRERTMGGRGKSCEAASWDAAPAPCPGSLLPEESRHLAGPGCEAGTAGQRPGWAGGRHRRHLPRARTARPGAGTPRHGVTEPAELRAGPRSATKFVRGPRARGPGVRGALTSRGPGCRTGRCCCSCLCRTCLRRSSRLSRTCQPITASPGPAPSPR